MERRGGLIALLILLLAAGCRDRVDGASAKAGGAPGQGADGSAAGATTNETCPECAGLGRSAVSGDDRPCLLCAGDGRCVICGGAGRSRDGACTSCEGSGRCLDCAGDGTISAAAHDAGSERAPVSGGCPVCILSCGVCPECGGLGVLALHRPCHFCEGRSWCPECRGSGANRLCGGEGTCPLCRGRGELRGGAPAPGLPSLVVHRTDGGQFRAVLLAPPTRMLTLERTLLSKVEREAISLDAIRRNDVLLAFRLFATPGDSGLRIASARYLLNAGPEFLFAARHDAGAARAAGASDAEIDLLEARIDDLLSDWFLARAREQMETDPRRAIVLLSTLRTRFPGGGEAGEVGRLLDELLSAEAAADSALPADVRERRDAALAGRIRRLARRAEEWRVRAEDLLAGERASEDDFHRAHRAAFEAWSIYALAANRAGPDLAPALVENAHQARSLRIRALIGLAFCGLERGYLGRARSLGAVALSLDPIDAGAIQFTAEVEGAMGRRANEVKDR